MTTLHSINSTIKTLLKWTTILTASLVLIILLIKVGARVKELLYPTPLPPAGEEFGKLLPIVFPKSDITSDGFSYSIDTLSGKLPEFPDRMRVFKTQEREPNLLALEKARNIIAKIGFKSPENQLSSLLFEWTTQEPYPRKIIYNILTSSFSLTSDYLLNEDILSPDLIDPNEAIETTQSFFNSLSSFPNDIDSAKTKASLYNIENNTLIPATSLSGTKAVRVDFFQKDVDTVQIFYEKPNKSNMYAILGGKQQEKQIIEANFVSNKISSSSATYYIKKTSEAFTLLKKNQAYIASYEGDQKNILIKNVFLVYYLPKKEVDILMPIIVFEGNDNFYAYVSALKTN